MIPPRRSSSSRRRFRVDWYDPRRGGKFQPGSVETLSGPGKKALGKPPQEAGRDWVALVRRVN